MQGVKERLAQNETESLQKSGSSEYPVFSFDVRHFKPRKKNNKMKIISACFKRHLGFKIDKRLNSNIRSHIFFFNFSGLKLARSKKSGYAIL